MNTKWNEDALIASDQYASVMEEDVLPWLESRQNVTLLPGYQDKPLYCVSWAADHPIGTVVLVHGFTENAMKLSELTFSLLHQGFSVLAYDQRGHGRSWRAEGLPHISVTHVDHFSDYVEDLRIVCASLLASLPSRDRILSGAISGYLPGRCSLRPHDRSESLRASPAGRHGHQQSRQPGAKRTELSVLHEALSRPGEFCHLLRHRSKPLSLV